MFCVRILAVLAEGSQEHMVSGKQTRALAGLNGLLWRGGVVSVGAGCGFLRWCTEEGWKETFRYRTEETLHQSRRNIRCKNQKNQQPGASEQNKQTLTFHSNRNPVINSGKPELLILTKSLKTQVFLVFKFPNSDSELKGSTSGQKIGPEDTIQGGPATLVLKPGRLVFVAIYITW